MYVCMYLCIYASIYLCVSVSMYLCIYVCFYLCIYVSMYVYIYIRIPICVCECLCVCIPHWQDEITCFQDLQVIERLDTLVPAFVDWMGRLASVVFESCDCRGGIRQMIQLYWAMMAGSRWGKKDSPHRKMRKHNCKSLQEPQQPAGVQWDGERRDAWTRSHWSFVISSQGKLPSRMCEGHRLFFWSLVGSSYVLVESPERRPVSMDKSACFVWNPHTCCFFQVLPSLLPQLWVEIGKCF